MYARCRFCDMLLLEQHQRVGRCGFCHATIPGAVPQAPALPAPAPEVPPAPLPAPEAVAVAAPDPGPASSLPVPRPPDWGMAAFTLAGLTQEKRGDVTRFSLTRVHERDTSILVLAMLGTVPFLAHGLAHLAPLFVEWVDAGVSVAAGLWLHWGFGRRWLDIEPDRVYAGLGSLPLSVRRSIDRERVVQVFVKARWYRRLDGGRVYELWARTDDMRELPLVGGIAWRDLADRMALEVSQALHIDPPSSSVK
jgi:hypothetical protein